MSRKPDINLIIQKLKNRLSFSMIVHFEQHIAK